MIAYLEFFFRLLNVHEYICSLVLLFTSIVLYTNCSLLSLFPLNNRKPMIIQIISIDSLKLLKLDIH